MAKFYSLIFIVFLILNNDIVSAQSLIQPFSFDCDVPPARFSIWAGNLSPGTQKVTGSIELLEPRNSDEWLPTAKVLLSGDEDDDYFGLQLYVDRDNPSKIQVALQSSSQSTKPYVINSIEWKAKPIKFAIFLIDSGKLEVTVNENYGVVLLPNYKLKRLSLICSTGNFKFTNIMVLP